MEDVREALRALVAITQQLTEAIAIADDNSDQPIKVLDGHRAVLLEQYTALANAVGDDEINIWAAFLHEADLEGL